MCDQPRLTLCASFLLDQFIQHVPAVIARQHMHQGMSTLSIDAIPGGMIQTHRIADFPLGEVNQVCIKVLEQQLLTLLT